MRNTIFSGMYPKVDDTSLQTNAAVRAENCLLHDGVIRPIKAQAPYKTIVNTDGHAIAAPATIHALESMVVGFPKPTSIAPDVLKRGGPDSFLFVEEGVLKRSSSKWILDHEGAVPLGVCRPTVAPTYVVTGSCDPSFDIKAPACIDEHIGGEDCKTQDYYPVTFLYTYMTACHEESAPSPYTEPFYLKTGEGVFLSNPTDVPDRVDKILWYMLVPTEKSSEAYLIGTTTPDDLGLQYCRSYSSFADILQSQQYHHPEPCLEGVAVLGNDMTVVWHTNEIWVSEPRQPHAYPHQFRRTLDPEIVIKAIVTLSTSQEGQPYWYAVILTNGSPYVLQGDAPENVVIKRLMRHAPCLNPAGVAVVEGQAYYASTDGLYAISTQGFSCITSQFFDKESWLRYDPASFSIGYHDSRLIMLHPSKNGLMMRLRREDSPYNPDIVELTPRATAVSAELGTNSLVTSGATNTSYLWEASDDVLLAFWRSKDYVQAGLWHPTAAKIVSPVMHDVVGEALTYADQYRRWVAETGGSLERFVLVHPEAKPYENELERLTVQFYLYNDGELFYHRRVRCNKPFRLVRNKRRMTWGYAVSTKIPVRELHIQTAIADLTQEGGHA